VSVARHDGEKLGWIVLDLGAAKANAKRNDYLEGAIYLPRLCYLSTAVELNCEVLTTHGRLFYNFKNFHDFFHVVTFGEAATTLATLLTNLDTTSGFIICT
jgi:hypothetical protein